MQFDATMLDIGREEQVFVDDLIIESVENVCRTWHQPVKLAANPVLQKDQPWETMSCFSCNTWQVLRDPKDGLFKCWYADWFKPEVKAGDMPMGKSVYKICYAESEDGLRWRKPLLGVHKVNGRDTNAVIPNTLIPALILDPQEKDESKRYKLICNVLPAGKDTDVSEIVAMASPDGIHWTQMPEKPQMGRSGSRLDDVIILHYDPYGQIFVMNTRHYDMYAVARNLGNPVVGHFTPPYYPLDWRRMNKRRIWQAESSDFMHWTDPYTVLVPEDGEDDLDETFYGLCQYPLGGLNLGFLNVMNYVSNTTRVRLVYSRNGKTWHHLNKRQSFITPEGEGKWDAFLVYITSKPIQVGNELYVYFAGAINHHDWWITGAREGLAVPEATDPSRSGYALGVAKMRPSGFVSLDAGPARRGIIITRPLISDGRQLLVNAKCHPSGSIAAEIVNLRDEIFPGYSRQECDVFAGDSLRHVVSWKGKTELPPAATERAEYPKAEFERLRKIRFYLEKAELYSLTMA